MLIHHFLENSAFINPDKVAIIHHDFEVTYDQLNRSSNSLAAWFIASGLQPGERVLLLLENGTEYVTAYYATLKAGLVAVPLSPDSRADTLQDILAVTTPRIIVASAKAEKTIHAIANFPPSLQAIILTTPRFSWQLRPFSTIPFTEAISSHTENQLTSIAATSLASILFTSGSTGKPKGVMLTHGNIAANTQSIIQSLELTAADRQMVVLPFHYVMGKSLLNTHIAVGGSLIINNSFAYPAAVLQQMAAKEVTGFSGVPATYAYLLHRSPLKSYRDRLHCLRYCSQAGGHMARQVKEQLLDALPVHTRLYVMYGATEASARLTCVEPDKLREKLDSIGIPIPGVVMRVIDADGIILPDGEAGELVASGSNIMVGYWNDPANSTTVLCSHGYRTGDIGYRDSDGYFHIVGRKDNQLKVGGHRINPQEIEDALMATNLLIESAVLGRTDNLLGQRMVAYAVTKDLKTTEQEILCRCLTLLPRHKIPGEMRIIPVLPKNSSGKIDRQFLQAMVQDRTIDSAPALRGETP